MPTTAAIELSFLADDVALLTFDLPDKGANILTQAVLGELASHLDELEKRKDLVGLIITSAKSNIFIAGADVTEFAASLDYPQEKTQEMSQAGQKLFQRLSRGPWVSVAAIHGTCLGGGAELAVWCDRRIVSDNERTEIGFPEVKLGIFPGWGGTVRLPRLVGLSNAVEMITSGNSVGPREAYAMGLADDITSPEDLVDAAVRLIRQEAESGAYLQDRKLREEAVEINETEYGFLGATASAYIQQQTKGQYPAPGMALETLLGGAILSAQEALGLEAIGLSELFGSPVSSALINVFLLTDRNKKDRGVDQSKPEVQEINRVSVIGAGIMGAGIAAANIKRGIHVKLNDARDEALESGIKEILDEVSFDKATKSKQVQRAIDHAALLIGTRSQAEIADVDLVIE
ncbi:MAG: enoyl-CoA hydratase-related protein, partial [Pirellulaceae bacterium]